MDPRAVPYVSVNQSGVFTPAQALADGWSERQVRRRLDNHRWQRVAGDGLSAASRPIGPAELGFAAILTWPDAVITHRLAGELWQFPLGPSAVATVTVGPHCRRQGFRLLPRRALLPAVDLTRLGGLPVTTLDRTALDLLALLPWSEARNLWAWLVTRNFIDLVRLRESIHRRSALKGTGQLRRLLDASAGGAVSEAEDVLHRILRAHGFSGWVANAPVRLAGRVVAVADVLFDQARIVIEVDGWSTHSDQVAFQRDRSRQNALVAAGYVVLRFTWTDLTQRPDHVAQVVRRTLATQDTNNRRESAH